MLERTVRKKSCQFFLPYIIEIVEDTEKLDMKMSILVLYFNGIIHEH